MAPEKEKPAVETVQQALKLSDLLMVDVCQPIKEQIDGTKLCWPVLPFGSKLCVPIRACTPIRDPICRPTMCNPIYVETSPGSRQSPEAWCGPGPPACRPDGRSWTPWQMEEEGWEAYLNMIQSDLAQKLTANELNTVREEVAALKKEIAGLKNQSKR